MTKEHYQATKALRLTEGQLAYHVDCFGNHLAKREGYKAHSGIEAVQFYLMNKHGWLPSQVRSMSHDDLRFCLEEEMSGWTLPTEALD
jgi:hypothetical protein